jgi:glucose/arabinose dehydrogenase
LSSYALGVNKSEILPITNPDPTFVQGIDGTGLEFRAPYREYVEIENKQRPYDYHNFSVSFWIKQIYDPNAQLGQIISHSNSQMKGGWFFKSVFNADSNYVQFVVSDQLKNTSESAEVPVSNSTFTHIVGTFNSSTVTVYRNGSLYDVQRSELGRDVSPDPIIPIHIGSASYCDSCERWSGIIDDVKLFNGAISEEQANLLFTEAVSENRSSGKNTEWKDPDLVGYWGFDGNLEDGSGRNNSAVVFTPIGSIVFSPDGRMFISEKNTGRIMIMEDNALLPNPFTSLDGLYVNWEQGLLGLAIDPKFQQNHYVYAYYTTTNNETGEPMNRVVRFTDSNNTATEMKILLDDIPASRGYHSGGALAFGPDDKLYITVGDATQHIFAQSISTLIGKVLRINADGSIPSDNPFPGSPVYTLGHRNMYGIAFDAHGNGILLENGDVLYDEINVIKKGGNYGFPVYQPANLPPELSNSTFDIKPIRSYWNTISPTQGIYYNGTEFPYLRDSFLFGTYTGNIYAVSLDNNSKNIDSESHLLLRNYPFEPVISMAESPDGNLYFGGFHIYQLTSLHLNDRVQDFFPLRVEMPDYVSVQQLQANPERNFVYLDISTSDNPQNENNSRAANATFTLSESTDPLSFLNLRKNTSLLNLTLPNSLLTNVEAIEMPQSGEDFGTKFSVAGGEDGNDNSSKTVSIPVVPGLNGRITIYGENK